MPPCSVTGRGADAGVRAAGRLARSPAPNFLALVVLWGLWGSVSPYRSDDHQIVRAACKYGNNPSMPKPWSVTRADDPVVATAIHNGHAVRPTVAPHIALNRQERLREEDPHTGFLAEVAPSHIIVHRSRFEVDLNRDPDAAVYTTPAQSWGLRVWQTPPRGELLEESRRLYDAFYRDLHSLLSHIEDVCGRFVVLDIHSYNHRREGPNAPPADPTENPEVNVGTGTLDRSRWGKVVDRFISDLSRTGLDVRENVKFRGRRLAAFIHESFPSTGCCLAIEVKKTFMDEHNGKIDPRKLHDLREALGTTLPGLRESLS